MPRGRALALLIIVVLGVTAGSLMLSDYLTFLATSAVIVGIAAMSVGLLAGQAGLASLCQMSFCGVGAWCACWLNLHLPQIPFLSVLILPPCAAGLSGALIGLPTLRLRGINLAAVTLAFAVACDALFIRIGFPGNETNTGFERPAWLADDHAVLVLGILAFAVVGGGVELLRKTKLGAAWTTIAHSERAAAALGVSVSSAKIVAFAIGAAIAGLAGALMAVQLGTLTGRNFEALTSLAVFSLSIFTAAHFLEGAAIAGLLTVMVPEVLRSLGLPLDLAEFLFGIGAVQALYRGVGIGGNIRAKLVNLTSDQRPIETRHIDVSHPVVARLPQPGSSLTITDLSVTYGQVKAVDHVSFEIPQRGVVALIGPNGAGKSTIIDAVSGFVRDYEGSVRMESTSLEPFAPDARARLGLRRTFQQSRATPHLTALEYLRLSAGRPVTLEESEELLCFFQCCSSHDRIGSLEIGLRRLIEVAGAVVARPRVLLLDEPAAGLAHQQSRILAERIVEIPKRFGCSILLVEHDMSLIQAVCTKVVVIDFGKVIASGPPQQALKSPEVIAAYLGKEVA
ncbi:ATP-binding cassette domain-containing protein [Methylocapsa sp. S129]|uniref:branched-chain amino acid ABC transporter ATP-binding protein/permease n=1 Tax=Methylocapsa sp. S129 TaxID=1641869 RepID=UPI00131ECD3B|nr:ATP-binding cassette domain-containing protein [Methylocapsa sp. S129]